MPAMAFHITHARPLSCFPALHARPYGIDVSDHFMAGNARVSESGKTTFNRQSIGVANPTGLDTDSDLPKSRLDNCSAGKPVEPCRASWFGDWSNQRWLQSKLGFGSGSFWKSFRTAVQRRELAEHHPVQSP